MDGTACAVGLPRGASPLRMTILVAFPTTLTSRFGVVRRRAIEALRPRRSEAAEK